MCVDMPCTHRIDFNALSPEGWIRVRLSNFIGDLVIGEQVRFYQTDEGTVGEGVVRRISEPFAWIEVDWESLRDG